ncbi:hypothetical protein SDC9_36375 [bioreactor metagenome]|uniref:Uncharacterized protein n=1 Tax=bioreactor metagenome TaxID=1076179 RepID=A0A644VGG9_9ZZZZ
MPSIRLRAGVAAPHPQIKKRDCSSIFCRKKDIQDKKNPHASEGQRPKAESKPKVCEQAKLCERDNSRRRASQRLACRLKWAFPIWAYSRLFFSQVSTPGTHNNSSYLKNMLTELSKTKKEDGKNLEFWFCFHRFCEQVNCRLEIF